MSVDSNPIAMPYRRYPGVIFGFVAGVTVTAVVMGLLWRWDSAQQQATISALSSQISEKDATISTLYSQLPMKDTGGGSSKSGGKPTAGQP